VEAYSKELRERVQTGLSEGRASLSGLKRPEPWRRCARSRDLPPAGETGSANGDGGLKGEEEEEAPLASGKKIPGGKRVEGARRHCESHCRILDARLVPMRAAVVIKLVCLVHPMITRRRFAAWTSTTSTSRRRTGRAGPVVVARAVAGHVERELRG
jgi:hypothetical protein